MPLKITSITIDNYKGWYGLYPAIELPNGENLLIYGENGSGKSSLFKGMQNFFRSAQDNKLPFELNHFAVQAGNINGSINVQFTDFSQTPPVNNIYTYTVGTGSTNDQGFIMNSAKLNSFLDYKYLLGVHFKDPEALEVPDLFKPLIEDLLGGFEIPATGKTIKEEINFIDEGLTKRSDSYHYQEAEPSVPIIGAAIAQIVNDVIVELNRLLNQYFDPHLQVQVVDYHFDIYPHYRKYVVKRFKVQVRYHNQVFQNYNYVLNEARLSAIAICFYLGAVLSHPPNAADYKVLLLDDIFIGLDTSNRLPLLQLLNDEFGSYQTIITTYDRNWFETAKHWFLFNSQTKWKTWEIYVDGITNNFEVPLIIQGHDNLKTAQENFLAKNYPAAANALRRECEAIIKKCLPDEMRFTADSNTGVTFEITQLETLYSSLIKFLEGNGINASFIKEFKFFQKNIFNPLSHSDIIAPHYRQEVSSAIDFVIKLREIKVKKVVSVSPEEYGILCLDTKHNLTWQSQHYEISCLDDVYAIKIGNNPAVMTNPRCNLYHHETNITWYYMDNPNLDLKNVFKTVWRVCKYPNPIDENLMYTWISNQNGETLQQLMIF